MEQNQKYLKIISWLLLAFAVLDLVKIVVTGIMGMAALSAGVGMIVAVVAVAISGLLLVPQVYVGVKGLAVAKAPSKAKAHITWAFVLMIVNFVGLLATAISFFKGEGNAAEVSSLAVQIFLYYLYITNAKKVQEAA